MNHVALSACIAEIGALRHTPAGLPALDLRLEHESQVVEAGQPRQVKAAVRAVALGSVAEAIARQPVGSPWGFTGFLATPRNGKHPVLHIQSFESV
ncbi:primosomal replication protein N [Ramlibacter tataouinensis]|uniref:primosomal replication protein N n=1 Tax=Ramlibacter tataouinensis TaxID=94132 RepID=UPI0022F390E8|nr:primosomal replication protein N [Ramlibacter tataouinensis]WBY01697.1 primosomal replication protein N [Ramlibacter tataouinensis]